MTLTTTAPIKQALVATLRANNTLRSAISGIHEGAAPRKVPYPFVAYNFLPTAYNYDSTGLMFVTAADVYAFSYNSVEANTLDALVFTTLQDADLLAVLDDGVTEQTTLICHRVADISSDDVDEEGKKVYQIGGSYAIWTDQPL
jgi:hypothetical protein